MAKKNNGLQYIKLKQQVNSYIPAVQSIHMDFLSALFLHSGSQGVGADASCEFNLDMLPVHHRADTELVLSYPSEHVTGLREEAWKEPAHTMQTAHRKDWSWNQLTRQC